MTVDLDALATLLPEDFDPGDTIRDAEGGAPPNYAAPERGQAGELDAALALGKELGRGGMAVVREAEQRVLMRAVAVKSARADRKTSAEQLVLEARITGALEHPGILPIHDIVLDAAEKPHIVMQRVDGTPWKDVMDDPEQLAESFGVSDVLAWNLGVLEAVCNAVHFAHSQGVVHRDLKPDNVMVGAFGQVYVVDWGVAVSIRDDDPRFPAAKDQRRIVGTPRFMGPEQARGDGRLVSVQTDVYLLGAVLFRIITGRPPHRGLGIREILGGIPEFVPSFPDGTPAELGQLVTDAMAVDPAERPDSAEVFRRRLRAFLEHRGSARLAAQATERLAALRELLDSDEADRVRVYDLFGAIRFGFREALEAWPSNAVAADGLVEASVLLAQWELSQGDDRAAEVLLGALDDAPAHLQEELARVRAERIANRGLLERLAADRDHTRGQWWRLGAPVVLAAMWSVSPILAQNATLPVRMAIAAFWAGLVIAIVAAGRRSWSATSVNRRVSRLLLAGVVSQALFMGGVPLGVFDLRAAFAGTIVGNTILLLLAGWFVDKRFWITGGVFALAFAFFGPLEPWRVYVNSFCHATLGGVAVWVWWPRSER